MICIQVELEKDLKYQNKWITVRFYNNWMICIQVELEKDLKYQNKCITVRLYKNKPLDILTLMIIEFHNTKGYNTKWRWQLAIRKIQNCDM